MLTYSFCFVFVCVSRDCACDNFSYTSPVLPSNIVKHLGFSCRFWFWGFLVLMETSFLDPSILLFLSEVVDL